MPCGFLVDECSTFIRFDTGRLGGEVGKHDDCVIAAAMAIQADKFMGAASEMEKPKKTPDKRSLEYTVYLERMEIESHIGEDEDEGDW